MITYRLFIDLQRGWRVTMPNLEQTGLLRVDYEDLDWLAAQDTKWSATHIALRDDTVEHRRELMANLLNELRRVLAIDADVLTPERLRPDHHPQRPVPDRPVGVARQRADGRHRDRVPPLRGQGRAPQRPVAVRARRVRAVVAPQGPVPAPGHTVGHHHRQRGHHRPVPGPGRGRDRAGGHHGLGRQPRVPGQRRGPGVVARGRHPGRG